MAQGGKTYTLPRNCIFHGPGVGLSVSRKTYFSNEDIWHEHEFFELVLVLGGRGLHIVENASCQIARGDVFLIKPGFKHCYQDLEGLEIVNILYLPERLAIPMADLRSIVGYLTLFDSSGFFYKDLREHGGFLLAESSVASAEALADELMREQKAHLPGRLFAMTTLFMRLILLLSRSIERLKWSDDERVAKLGEIASYVDAHCKEGIQVSDISRFAKMSPRTLERFFLSAFGMAPRQYLCDARLRKAASALAQSSSPVSAIASEAGFADACYFSRAFRSKFGLSPSSYRKASTAC